MSESDKIYSGLPGLKLKLRYIMEKKLKKQEAIINLHEKGFTDDFQLVGNNLLWVQGKTYLQREDFSVLEFYKFDKKNKTTTRSELILGIQSLGHNAKGILIQHTTNIGFSFSKYNTMEELDVFENILKCCLQEACV